MAEEYKLKTPAEAQLGELELYPNPGGWLKDVFLEQGVTHFFGVYGGHMWSFVDPCIKAGINHITYRHEEQAAYTAEGYARTHAGLGAVKPGVCCGTVGPGVTNLVSGVHQAYWSSTPMVVIVAGHESDHDGVYTLQECYAAEIYKPFTKWTKRLVDNATYKRYFTRALHDSQIPTRGPVLLEFEVNQMLAPPHDVLMVHDPPNQFGYKPGWLKRPISPAYPNPQDVEAAVKAIYQAERPCIFGHDGMMWNNVGPELVEFSELAQVPCMTRRWGRGSMPEDHPLTCKAGSLIDESDLMCLIGGKLDFYDFWGVRWKIDNTLQINDDQELIHPWLPTEVGIVADAKVTLRQMIDCAKSNGYKVREDRAKWIARIQELERGRVALWERRAQQFKDEKPLHACWISKIMSDTSEEMYRGRVPVMFDSFTLSNILSPYLKSRRAGQIIDSGCQAGVGHGVGQAIGTAFALREKGDNTPVLACMGDAGMGHAMDIETAIRHSLPIVFLVFNNDIWIGSAEGTYGMDFEWYGRDWTKQVKPHYFTPDMRYDQMWEAVGAHGEWVTEPAALKDALVRCFRAAERGQPAVCNVDSNRRPIQSVIDSALVMFMYRWIPWSECTDWMKKCRIRYASFLFPGIAKYGFDKLPKEVLDYDRYYPTDEDYKIKG